MTELFKIENLFVSFGKKQVLKNINLIIKKGEIFALIGPSGAGKTTFLRLLNFFEIPDKGSILFDSGNYEKNSARKKMSLIFQTPVVFNTSVFNNVAYGLKLRKADKIKEKVFHALFIVGLSGYENQKACSLSVGEAQRMAFARAIVYKPDVLLLDEPTASLDPFNVAKIEEIIKLINSERKTTIVMATHNIPQVKRIADRVGVLIDGELIEVNDKKDIFLKPIDKRTYAFLNGEMIY